MKTTTDLLNEIEAYFERRPAAAYFPINPSDRKLAGELFDAGLVTFCGSFERVSPLTTPLRLTANRLRSTEK